MSAFLWGVAGAAVLDVALLLTLILVAPRLFKAAMRKQAGAMLGSLGSKPAGSTLSASIDPAGRAAYEARQKVG